MKTARKAAAPKPSGWEGESGDEAEVDSEAEAARDDVPQPAAAPAEASTSTEKAESKDERAARKAEKAAKRDERRGERKARRAAEREAAAAKAKAEAERAARRAAQAEAGEGEETQVDGQLSPSGEEGDEEDEEGEEQGEGEEQEQGDDEDGIPDLPSRLSPPPLEPFPLPRMAPAPAADVLSRQGLPSGLADASFVDQSLRMALSDVELSERTSKRLGELGVEDFFAVQAAILPKLLSLPLVPRPHAALSDFLISAPTGSGKTLAYAVPVVEVLAKRVVPRLRALIVLPTRDLVVQVRETLETLAKGTGLLVS
jgi:ATP-dependent RNA helicase DDX51/DBP6